MIRQSELRFKVGETDAALTGFGGAAALVNLAHDTGMLADLDRCVELKQRRRGFACSASVTDLMLLMCSGGQCIDDLEVLRQDKGLSRLLGRSMMASSTAHDFLRKISSDALDGLASVRRSLLEQVASARDEKCATLDCDAVFFPSSAGEARMSYLGERGWMPMLAYWAELGGVVHDEFRYGNESPGGGAVQFLKESVAQLPESVERVRVRSDSAWYNAELMDWCHERNYEFSITVKRDSAVQELIDGVCDDQWIEIHGCGGQHNRERPLRQWAFETVHTLNGSRHAFRMILLKRERREPDLIYGEYTFGAIITNMNLTTESQLRWHYERCNSENYHKELKYGFSLRVLPSGNFEVNCAWFRIGTLAFNLINAFKHLKLDESWRYLTIKTIRFRLLHIPALVTEHARNLWLKFPRRHPYLPTLRLALQ